MDLLRSLPLGLYLEQPVTWLHQLDPRVKFAWLMSFLTTYVLASSQWRVLLVALLIAITLTARIPIRVWRQQMGWLLTLSFFVLLLAAVMPDGLGAKYQHRLPADELAFVQLPTSSGNAMPDPQDHPPDHPWYNPFGWGSKSSLPMPAVNAPNPTKVPQPTNYRYILFQQGPITVNRHSLGLAVSLSTILFNVIYSTNLCLLTTAPEEITAGIESLMRPLRRLNWPVTEIALTLTLSLRFIPLVLEEVQNLIRSVQTRAINWKKLGVRGAVRVWLMVAERLLENLLLRAEQMANAITVRGFTSPNTHRVQWHQLRLKRGDWVALVSLVVFWGARLLVGNAS